MGAGSDRRNGQIRRWSSSRSAATPTQIAGFAVALRMKGETAGEVSGLAEAMMEQDLGPWDLAAPTVVVEEAGGMVTDVEGKRSMAAGEGLATNGVIHGAILDRLWGRL